MNPVEPNDAWHATLERLRTRIATLARQTDPHLSRRTPLVRWLRHLTEPALAARKGRTLADLAKVPEAAERQALETAIVVWTVTRENTHLSEQLAFDFAHRYAIGLRAEAAKRACGSGSRSRDEACAAVLADATDRLTAALAEADRRLDEKIVLGIGVHVDAFKPSNVVGPKVFSGDIESFLKIVAEALERHDALAGNPPPKTIVVDVSHAARLVSPGLTYHLVPPHPIQREIGGKMRTCVDRRRVLPTVSCFVTLQRTADYLENADTWSEHADPLNEASRKQLSGYTHIIVTIDARTKGPSPNTDDGPRGSWYPATDPDQPTNSAT